jgi:predicted lipoprotein with Yx(FWY)xxD motif
VTLVATACGSGHSNAATTGAASLSHQPAAEAQSTPVVATATNSKLGKVLVDSKGLTLYYFSLDKAGSTACTGACLQAWPPLLLPSGVTTPTGSTGVTGLGTFMRAAGQIQVTYHGHLLYTFEGDNGPGQANGQGVKDSGGQWFVVSVALTSAAAASPDVTASPTTATPATSPPVTNAPITAAPVTNPPVTSPPVTRPPVTSPPVTSPPVTQPPVTTLPTTKPTTPPTTAPSGGYGY